MRLFGFLIVCFIVIDKINQFADACEEGEFGIGGGAAFLVEVVVVFAEEDDEFSGVPKIAFEQEIMRLHIIG